MDSDYEHNPPDPAEDPAGRQTGPGDLWSRWSPGRLLVWGLLLYAANVSLQLIVFTLTDDLFLPVAAGSLLAVLLPCALVSRRTGGSLATDFHLGAVSPAVAAWSAIAAVAAMVPTSLLAQLSVRIYPVSQTWLDFYLEHLPEGTTEIALAAVTVVVFAPVGEELLFRGIVHRLASRIWGAVPAAVVSALIFALVHLEPWYLFGLFGLALLLAFVYEATRSVTACVITHSVHNAISFAFLMNQADSAMAGTGASGLDILFLGGSILLLALACMQLVRHGEAARR